MSTSTSTNPTSSTSADAVINDYLSGNNDINATVDALCQPIEDQYQTTGEASVYPLWKAVQNAAQQTPYTSPNQQSLVDVMVTIANRPTPERNGEPCIIQNMTVWKDLPTFGFLLREAWNFDTPGNTDPNLQNQWLNLNAWTCQLTTASQTQSIPALDFSLFGLWTIREGLEGAQQPTDAVVESAAIWLLYGASLIYDLSQQSRTFQGKLAQPGPAFQDRDWTGYSEDRWSAWAERLSELQSSVESERTAELVQMASDAMAQCGLE